MKKLFLILFLAISVSGVHAQALQAVLQLKAPGNPAVEIPLIPHDVNDTVCLMTAARPLPITIVQRTFHRAAGTELSISITADTDCWFRYDLLLPTSFTHADCQFLMPGFWYRHNLRSPCEAPSFHTADSWQVREDRLSSPLCGIFDPHSGQGIRIARLNPPSCDALVTAYEGEVLLSGPTEVGYTGFENRTGIAFFSFGFPYREAPRSYLRKLELAPPVSAFMKLKRGETIRLQWEISTVAAADFSEFVHRTWEYAFDTYHPAPVEGMPDDKYMKEVLSRYFDASYVDDRPLKYTSGVHIKVNDYVHGGGAEVGFIGRVLLNAFNALEYAEAYGLDSMRIQSYSIYDSYLAHGFSENGFLHEFVDYGRGYVEPVHSIRRQAEGVYAALHFLKYERDRGRHHPHWEKRIIRMLDRFLDLQKADGSLPRKFNDDLTVIDASGGSTSSATLPLVMGYKYFQDSRYLAGAQRTMEYLDREIISKADYFSSTLDANCEDKEASLYAATAAYYLALISQGKVREHYAALCRKAAYFALSWYYTWDVPFAQGQMLGDMGFHSRGWGNVSVENNHIDVFVFEFASILRWLAVEYQEPRFAAMSNVINTSMRQLLPYKGHLCGVAKAGYYPEVVQHTVWDYGHNGKGYYNDIFAPGWTVASLWELLTPRRTEYFFSDQKNKQCKKIKIRQQ